MTKIIASLVLAGSIFVGIGAAQAGSFDAKGSYVAPGGLYTPFDASSK